MKTIEAFEKDVFLQIPFLQSFKPEPKLSDFTLRKAIFCGSGDSFASALLAEAHSNLQTHAADPLDLLKNKHLINKNYIFLISISGNTISNIKVAKLAKKPIAITSQPQSRLAKACSKTIHLNFPNSDIFTGGSLSFLQSALTCMSLVSNFDVPDSLKIFKKAIRESQKIKFSKRIFILGNLHTYPIAMYAAAKFYELLGLDVHFERIEQFSHMELFSATKGDTVIIFEEKNSHNKQLVKNLRKLGLGVFQPTLGTRNKISQFLFFTFLAQLIPLLEAKRKKQKDCHFITSKNLRNASNKMIY